MKNLIIIPVLCLALTLFGQTKGTATDAVKTEFKKFYPEATKVKYEKEGDKYEVSFKLNGKEMSVIYDMKGNLQETEEAIKSEQLPKSVLPYFNTHYKGATIKETAMIKNNKGVITYEIGTKGKDIIFDASGNFLKEVKD